jgi:ABC-type branched-subunit amino acid transport system substrate-binding protein
MLSFRIVALAFILAFSSAPAFAQGGEHDLEQLLVESASTPAQHQALAQHFHAKAAKARAEAKQHRSMADSYAGTKLVIAAAQRKHCNDLAAGLEAQAKLYDELAAGHEAEAKKK